MGYCLFVLAVTNTRGAVVALALAVLYLLVLMRRRLQVVPTTILVCTTAAALAILEYFVSNFTHSGSVVGRIAETKFKGYLPDSRADVWPAAVERMMHHPLIGWGPYYSNLTGLHFWYWPHDLYLYIANTIGLLGLACYLWLF
jgi:O-antigen ligase